MGIPCASIIGYQELVRKLLHQFPVICHRKMFTTSLFKIRQGSSELLRDYLTQFNEATIKVVPSNQEIFVWSFQNGLKPRHLNESLA